MAIFIMLNNFFHDFSVALLFTSLFMTAFLYSRVKNSPEVYDFYRDMYGTLTHFIIGCWVFIIVGGAIRTWAYADYEWSEAAGRGQIAALIIKHILLVTLVVWGSILQYRLKKIFKTEKVIS